MIIDKTMLNQSYDSITHCMPLVDSGSSNCTDGEVRLRDGVTDWDGRVEICLNRVWGAVCNTNWDETDAETVCRQLHVTGERDSITLSKNRLDACDQDILYYS